MNNQNKLRSIYALILVLGTVILTFADQWTKYLAVLHLKGQDSITLISGVFELQYLENTGAAFGILNNQQWLFYCMTVILVILIVWLYFKMPMKRYYLPAHVVLIFITAGALGNFIDRVRYQYVVDFFYFSLIDFPIFNVADIYVTVGTAVVFLLILFKYKDEDFAFLSNKKTH